VRSSITITLGDLALLAIALFLGLAYFFGWG
jgi:hypothetical protein